MLDRHPKIVALGAGLLSATGFAPLQAWPVTLICLALFAQTLWRAPDRRAALWRGWLFGVGHFTVGLNWIAHAFTFQDAMPHWFGYGAVILLSLYLAVYPAMAAGLAWRYGRGRAWRFVLLLAAGWMVTEWLRATLFTGFAWNPLGVIWLPVGVAQAATLIGTYGLSGLAMLAGGALWLMMQGAERRRGLAVLAGVAILALVGSAREWMEPRPGADRPRIRVVQPNIGQQDKYSPLLEEQNFRKLASLSGSATREPRLIFWPEAAVPAFLDIEPEWRRRIASIMGPRDLLMTGAVKVYFSAAPRGVAVSRDMIGANNSLWIVNPRGGMIGRYDKSHLVPYGEYLPMREILQPLGLSRLVPGDVDFWPGPGPRTLNLPGFGTMGVQICYEIIFSGHVVDAAHRPDFLFNPSNDAWFGAWGPPQHLAQARLRAIEEGMPVIRSTPTGISAVVSARGDVLDRIPAGVAGSIDARLPEPAAATPFARLGNYLPALCVLILLALAWRDRRRSVG